MSLSLSLALSKNHFKNNFKDRFLILRITLHFWRELFFREENINFREESQTIIISLFELQPNYIRNGFFNIFFEMSFCNMSTAGLQNITISITNCSKDFMLKTL